MGFGKHRLLLSHQKSSGGSGWDNITKEDAGEFRRFLYRAATGGKKDSFGTPTKILAMHAMKARHITNIFDLVDALSDRGAPAELAFLDNLDFSAKVDMTANAAVALTIHGEGSANAVFLQENATLYEVFPFGVEPSPVYADVTALFGVGYKSWQAPSKDCSTFHGDVLDRHGLVGADRAAVADAPTLQEALSAAAAGGGAATTLPEIRAAAEEFWMDQDTTIDVEQVAQDIVAEYESKEKPVVKKATSNEDK